MSEQYELQDLDNTRRQEEEQQKRRQNSVVD